MTDLNAEDVVIVHHNELGPLTGDRRNLGLLLQRGREETVEAMLLADVDGPDALGNTMGHMPLPLCVVDVGPHGEATLKACTMLWISPNVSHISPSDSSFARTVVATLAQLRAKQVGIVLDDHTYGTG